MKQMNVVHGERKENAATLIHREYSEVANR